MICRFVEILRAVCQETLQAVHQLLAGRPIAEQTVVAWLLLNETEENYCFRCPCRGSLLQEGTFGRASPLNLQAASRRNISSFSNDLSMFFRAFPDLSNEVDMMRGCIVSQERLPEVAKQIAGGKFRNCCNQACVLKKSRRRCGFPSVLPSVCF